MLGDKYIKTNPYNYFMSVNFQLLGSDYIMTNGKPTVRLFGRTEDNKSITVFCNGSLPYFYVLPTRNETEIRNFLKNKFKDLLVKVETVEKFLPIGYSDKDVKLLKITLKDPSKVPFIRDSLRSKIPSSNIFEADILYRSRYMVDNKLFGMRWYNVTGDIVQTQTVKTAKKIEAKKIKEVEIDKNMKFKYLSFDIEVLPRKGEIPTAEKDAIIMMSIFFYPAFKGKNTMVLAAKSIKKFDNDIVGFSSEKEMLKEFVKIIDQFDPDAILGYNINGFDLPYLETRLKKNNVTRCIGRCTHKPFSSRKFVHRWRTNITGRIIIDVYDLVREATTKFGLFRGLKHYTLAAVSKMVIGETKEKLSAKDFVEMWADGGKKLHKLINYSRKDAELPFRIMMEKNMLDKFIEISKVSGACLQDVLNGGEATRIENIVLYEFNRRGFVVPCKPVSEMLARRSSERRSEGLKGAFVLEPAIGFHDRSVAYLDFKSMYPSIIISLNICPTTLIIKDGHKDFHKTPSGSKFVKQDIREGIIPQIVEYLITTRDKIKKEMRGERDKNRKNYLYAKQYAFKTVANAFYGYLGYIRAKLYVLDIANGITSMGREMILKTKTIIETKSPYKVIYADTDSVMIKLETNNLEEAFKTGDGLAKLINKEIHHILKMKIEGVFQTLLILSKKRYAGVCFEPTDNGWEENLIMKGIETVRRDWCDIVSTTLNKVLNAILKERDVKKAVTIVKNTVKDIQTGKVDIDSLVITKSISKALSSYKGVQPHTEVVKKMRARDPASAPTVGDRVGFVIVKGLGLVSKRAEDPGYVKEHHLEIDSNYYINSQLLPPLERVFEALDVSKSDLTGAGKQLGIIEAMRNHKSKTPFVEELKEIDGLTCNACSTTFTRIPLSGKCDTCSGEIVFFKGEVKSRVYDPWTSQTLTS